MHLQILSITGDNASNNDGMIRYLGETLDAFPGSANQTRCFVHTVNLIAKSILKPFDTRKSKKTKDLRAFNDAAQAIDEVTEGTEQERGEDNADNGENEMANGGKDKDVDEHDEPLDNEVAMSLGPIRSTLEKVCLFTFHGPSRILS